MSDKIRESKLRIGNFTSSNIGKLMKNGKQIYGLGAEAAEYVQEKNFEREMDLTIETDSNSHPFSWGKACEKIAFDNILNMDGSGDTSYKLISQETIQHPEFDYWVGSPDSIRYGKEAAAPEFKCPITRKSYMTFYKCEDIMQVRQNHKSGNDYFFQANSNFILLKAKYPELNFKYAELIIFMPYRSQLPQIVDLCKNSDYFEMDQLYKYMWIASANEEELPYLKDEGKIKNFKVFRWEVTPPMVAELTNRIKMCGDLLIPR